MLKNSRAVSQLIFFLTNIYILLNCIGKTFWATLYKLTFIIETVFQNCFPLYRLAKHDMVATTYSIVQNECEKSGPVFAIKWRRIILDEAHQVRNHKTLTSIAVCRLSGKARWCLTGTPVHNKEEDLYGLLKFLRCSPFDDLAVSPKI